VAFEPNSVLARVTCPVLAIFGERDDMVPSARSADVFASALQRAGNGDVTIGRSLARGTAFNWTRLAGLPTVIWSS